MQKRLPLETATVTTLWMTDALLDKRAGFDRYAVVAFSDSIVTPGATQWHFDTIDGCRLPERSTRFEVIRTSGFSKKMKAKSGGDIHQNGLFIQLH